MININYPEPDFKIKSEAGRDYIFDALRKKWLLLTPEEWVRQNFVQYLIIEKKYPATMVAMEKGIKLGELRKRFDILIYNRQHIPWMMIECKAAGIKMNEVVLQQVLRYNISVPVKYIFITNGTDVFGWKKESNELKMISEVPAWDEAIEIN